MENAISRVCGEIVDTNDSLDYFPSYESAILTKDWSVWNHDKRHVTDAFVGKIVRRLASAYFAQADEASKLFQEAYTEHNNGNNRQAHELIEKALSKKAQDPEWWRLAATVQRDLLEFDEALDRINRALELEPGSGDNHYAGR